MKIIKEDRKRIEESIRQKYIKVAISPEGLFKYKTGREGLDFLNYDKEIIQSFPDGAVASFCGVGNPFTLWPIRKGEDVLDIGCGTGVDTLIAAIKVEPEGRAIGIDMTHEIIDKAKKNLRETFVKNVAFQQASAENLPFSDENFDVVISNGVFNLIPDKAKALSEMFRVLKPDGRIMIADQILTGELQKDIKARIESWFR